MKRIRDEHIRGRTHVRCCGDKAGKSRLRWFGLEQRRDSEYISRRMLLSRGRAKRRFLAGVKEDVKLVGVREEESGWFIFVFPTFLIIVV